MARQKGFIRLDGKLGGLSFYKMEGKDVVRTPGGPSKEKIFHHPNFEITRRNISEFGAASEQAKRLRLLLWPLLYAAKPGRLQGKLSKLMRKICELDTEGTFGKRAFKMEMSGVVLNGLDLCQKSSVGQIFKGKYSMSSNSDRNEGTISIDAFDASKDLTLPEGATHFKFTSGMGAIADYRYSDELNSYIPATLVGENIFVMEESTMLPTVGVCLGLGLVTSFPEGLLPSAEIGVIQVLATRFYQKVNEDFKPLQAGFGIQIVGVF